MGRERSGGGGKGGVDGALWELRERVAAWRRTRTTRAMPEALWSAAVELAGDHGVYAVANALGLNHGRLRERAEERVGAKEGSTARAPQFVEVAMVTGAAAATMSVVELSRSDGARMTIRLAGAVDAAELTAAFLGRCR